MNPKQGFIGPPTAQKALNVRKILPADEGSKGRTLGLVCFHSSPNDNRKRKYPMGSKNIPMEVRFGREYLELALS